MSSASLDRNSIFYYIICQLCSHCFFYFFFMRLRPTHTHRQSFSVPADRLLCSSVTPCHTGWACKLVWGLSGTLPLPLTGVSFLSFIDHICAALLPPSCNSPKAFKLYTLGSVFVYCCKKISCLSQCWVNNTAPLAHTQANITKIGLFGFLSRLKTYRCPVLVHQFFNFFTRNFYKNTSPHAFANGNFLPSGKKRHVHTTY